MRLSRRAARAPAPGWVSQRRAAARSASAASETERVRAKSGKRSGQRPPRRGTSTGSPSAQSINQRSSAGPVSDRPAARSCRASSRRMRSRSIRSAEVAPASKKPGLECGGKGDFMTKSCAPLSGNAMVPSSRIQTFSAAAVRARVSRKTAAAWAIIMEGPGPTLGALGESVNPRDSGIERAGQTKTDIVVPVGGVVPGTTAENPTRRGPARARGRDEPETARVTLFN